MKTMKIYKIMLVAFVLFVASSSITNVKAEAKAYKTKTIKVTVFKSKKVKTKKKIRKITICSKDKNFDVSYLTSAKKFKVYDTDYGKTQTIKVKYTNSRTQKYKIKTVLPSYAKKIVNELNPLLANPDEGLQKILIDWKNYWESEDNCTYKLIINGHTYKQGTNYNVSIPLDVLLENYTKSQKKAFILQAYCTQRMTYGKRCNYKFNRSHSNKFFKQLYQGKFMGVCEDGASIAYDICGFLGMKAYYVVDKDQNHAWTVIRATDKHGTSYWAGIATTSYGRNLKASLPTKYNWGTTTVWYDNEVPPAELNKVTFKKYYDALRPTISFVLKSDEIKKIRK
ncbi:MAG: hypothetical protein J1F22_01310 [Lachnospiraceae bacterium]|nr:hypothetical protein [Lachnospiraceae bacterium]